jgi:hypothetical protein
LLLYENIGRLLTKLIYEFGLEDKRDHIMMCYNTICKESLAIPIGEKSHFFSRINADGIPFQLAVSLGSQTPSLKFLGEVGTPRISNFDRVMLSRVRIRNLTSLLCNEEKLSEMGSALDTIAPTSDRDLMSDSAGAFWIGAGFPQRGNSTLKVYINGKVGNEKKMWDRLDSFARYFSSSEQWSFVKSLIGGKMKPLGMGISARAGSPSDARIYLNSYGNPLAYYANLISSFVNSEKDVLQQFADVFLGESCNYPLKSVVCSFGINSQLEPRFKFEICGHCIFNSDKEALEKSLDWARRINLDPDMYFKMLGIMSGRNIDSARNNLHSFLGFGVDGGKVSSTIYLKPDSSIVYD